MTSPEWIDGAAKLTRIFGYWPSFHDAEVLWVRLDRGPVHEEGGCGPALEALFHAFEMTNEVGPDGVYVQRHHVLVRLRFHDISGLNLEGFNHQNVLFEMSISDLRELEMEKIDFEVTLTTSYGLRGCFQCHRVEVIEVTPCTEKAVPL
ncbi:MAG: Imm50 family immunity protein [Paludisphaera borealis]|uniref:Imm50 family immunity protein n=1 Tax=Paludisphaera borealis TaxID=1387353 RepID=UPI00283CDF4A|nr:Imm50 family immunity protein [Paludisphaera borealis]MDR3621416.1 Imm50 family immunity protein [Paludisphaera borealis]